MPTQQIPVRASVSSACLESAWKALRKLIPNLPPAVLVPLAAGGRRSKYGHFAPHCWKRNRRSEQAHEIAVSPNLFENPEDLLAVLLHEAAHALLLDQNGGCSGRYYHKKVFREQCLRLGLQCEFRNTRFGWTSTGWGADGIPARYIPLIDRLRETLPLGTGEPRFIRNPVKRELPPSGRVRLACKCDARSIYAPLGVAKEGGILCRFCGAEFLVRPA